MLGVKSLVDHLGAIGNPILDRDLVLYILRDLGPRYISFVSSINMKETCPILGILHNHLEGYECILERKNYVDYSASSK